MNKPLLSLCLPTNGIVEWVFPVLESIFEQKIDNNLFEVIVTNNGNNDKFHQRMIKYLQEHKNLTYKKTDAFMFHNQLEALKLASGKYLKLINHRAILKKGSIERIIEVINNNIIDKPVIYFSNGVLEKDFYAKSFDEFVQKLGRYASWTTGVGIWKSDYENLPPDIKIDKISPHSCILFANRDRHSYKIINFEFCKEIEANHSKKGNYDLFKAFGIEELTITQNLYIDGDITISTLKKIKKDYKLFVSELYLKFIIRKEPCSYNLTGFNDAMGIYFNKYEIIFLALLKGIKIIFNRIFGGIKK